MAHLIRTGLVIGAVLMLGACGGGGGGGDDVVDGGGGETPNPPPVDPTVGTLSVAMGSLESGAAGCGYVDGPVATARFNGVYLIHFTASGDMILAESPPGSGVCGESGPARLRKVTPTGTVSTLAQGASYGRLAYQEPPFTSFRNPLSITSAVDGTVIVADGFCFHGCDVYAGQPDYVYFLPGKGPGIWRVSPEGQISQLAGVSNGGAMIDGTGTEAVFMDPYTIAMDKSGVLYVQDEPALRQVTQDGKVSGQLPYSLDAIKQGPGQELYGAQGGNLIDLSTGKTVFSLPPLQEIFDIAVDRHGNVYMYCKGEFGKGNSVIRRWSPGQTSAEIVVGQTTPVYPGGIVVGTLPGRLDYELQIAIGPEDVLYITAGTAVLKVVFPKAAP